MKSNCLQNSRILITGGTGSFGSAFVRFALENGASRVVIYSRDELKQFELSRHLESEGYDLSKVRLFIGDVRDFARLKMALRNIDLVVHAAALKHVKVGESNPIEMVKTNILGAQNVIEACIENPDITKVIALSTDKACSPANLYGATKLTSDRLFCASSTYVGARNLKFSCVRYGNVFGSRGSIVPLCRDRLDKGQRLVLTDKQMTRFTITISQAVRFVADSFSKMQGGEVFVPKLAAYKVIDLLAAFGERDPDIIGIQPGEKIHEMMISRDDSRSAHEYEHHFIIGAQPNRKIEPFEYSSDNPERFLTVEELKQLIDNES